MQTAWTRSLLQGSSNLGDWAEKRHSRKKERQKQINKQTRKNALFFVFFPQIARAQRIHTTSYIKKKKDRKRRKKRKIDDEAQHLGQILPLCFSLSLLGSFTPFGKNATDPSKMGNAYSNYHKTHIHTHTQERWWKLNIYGEKFSDSFCFVFLFPAQTLSQVLV